MNRKLCCLDPCSRRKRVVVIVLIPSERMRWREIITVANRVDLPGKERFIYINCLPPMLRACDTFWEESVTEGVTDNE